ncbi:hypothetical protein E1286_12180 [Nonomuraea terrae]|uniref:Uncharacterized protein n=1 Tax=Nonomuraea terrae TaxID=2530383 RepID=A0A4R4Z318_9ACTN|nr:hypothetical protein [Nonomuraea terrae]TDD50422.1 hypothetical protein E1286_12180 [Nonomuraea terrae]
MPTLKTLIAGLAISTAMTGAVVAGGGAMTTAEASAAQIGAATAPVVAAGRCHKIRRCGWGWRRGGWGGWRRHHHKQRIKVIVVNHNINNNDNDNRRHHRHHDDFDNWDW